MASSRLIAAGETYTPDDINNLRADVLDPVGGHKHNGVDGAKVPFSNLDVTGTAGSAAPSGGSKSYNDIANHVASNQGHHGLGSSAYILGTPAAAGFVIQAGFDSGIGNHIISFPIQFTAAGVATPPVSVIVTPKSSVPDPFSNTIGATIISITASSFRVDIDGDNQAGVYWMAMGTLT